MSTCNRLDLEITLGSRVSTTFAQNLPDTRTRDANSIIPIIGTPCQPRGPTAHWNSSTKHPLSGWAQPPIRMISSNMISFRRSSACERLCTHSDPWSRSLTHTHRWYHSRQCCCWHCTILSNFSTRCPELLFTLGWKATDWVGAIDVDQVTFWSAIFGHFS